MRKQGGAAAGSPLDLLRPPVAYSAAPFGNLEALPLFQLSQTEALRSTGARSTEALHFLPGRSRTEWLSEVRPLQCQPLLLEHFGWKRPKEALRSR